MESENQQAPLLRASQSFKVLVECPIATVLFTNELDQSISKYSSILVLLASKYGNAPTFSALMCHIYALFQLLQLQVQQQQCAHEESAKSDNIGVVPDIQNHTAYTDFIGAQTKVGPWPLV